MSPDLLVLALASEKVTDLARAAVNGELDEPARLHQAMHEYEKVAIGYLGRPSIADFILSDAERYSDKKILAAMQRLAQLVHRFEQGEPA